MAHDRYWGRPDHDHAGPRRVGVLLVNLGTPDAPTPRALRPYLADFLFDPRVIEIHPVKWWLIMRLFVLPFRPRRSAALYRNVWTAEGSPLLVHTRRQAEALERRLAERFGERVLVGWGMRVGRPPLGEALRELSRRGADRVLVIPLYPQYSGTTAGSMFDGVTAELSRWRRVPELRTVMQFHDHPLYIEALARLVREARAGDGPAERLVISFHGIPLRYFLAGDPYYCQCHKTARLLAAALGLPDEAWTMTFQSRFGRERWLEPYTDDTLVRLAAEGVRDVDVVCPGFLADCLETLDEIGRESRHRFLAAGGRRLRLIPCLNERPELIDALERIAVEQLAGWIEGFPADPTAERAAAEARVRRQRAAERALTRS